MHAGKGRYDLYNREVTQGESSELITHLLWSVRAFMKLGDHMLAANNLSKIVNCFCSSFCKLLWFPKKSFKSEPDFLSLKLSVLSFHRETLTSYCDILYLGFLINN